MKLPNRSEIQTFLLAAGCRYWPLDAQLVKELPIVDCSPRLPESWPLTYTEVELPTWGQELGIHGKLLVPAFCASDGDYRKVDWWTAAFLLLSCWDDNQFEVRNQPTHSYSYQLQAAGVDSRIWERAWVNRIFLFLRRWAAVENRLDPVNESRILGEMPKAEIVLTHDVDAVRKTLPIRLKQGAFQVFNLCKCVLKLDFRNAYDRAQKALRFLFHGSQYDQLTRVLELEKKYNLKSTFHFYGGFGRPRTLQDWFFDPGYRIDEKLEKWAKEAAKGGWTLGLHPGFSSFNSSDKMSKERSYLESRFSTEIAYSRQHWLRFSWAETLIQLESARLQVDSTLGYNDRPGFRASAALLFHPWNFQGNCPYKIKEVPLVLMDSQLFDYAQMNELQRANALRRWLDEIKETAGTAAVLWHPHTLAEDYGWGPQFEKLLQEIQLVTG